MSEPARDGQGHIDPLVAALAATVAEYRVRRVPLTALRAAFARHDPTGVTSSDSRVRLLAAVTALAHAGTVTVPKSARLFESHLLPALPMWVERAATPRVSAPARPVRIWRPELAAAAEQARSSSDFDVLERVDAFLRAGGAHRPMVPHRERSVELFGHEKRLDALLRTRLFATDALTLDLLRCEQPPLPLTAQHTGDPGPDPALLIVENHATYASVLRLARDRAAAGAPALAVGYGSGNQLPSAIGGAAQLAPVPAALWYFGDLDADGLRIAADAARAAVRAELPALRPAVPLYRELLRVGTRQPGEPVIPAERAWQLVAWLAEPDLMGAAAAVLTAGERIAQECVGYERFAALPTWV